MPADEDGLTKAELAFLRALDEAGVRYMVIGMAAALIQGADAATEDIDLWLEHADASVLRRIATELGAFYTDRTQPPMLGQGGLDRIDLVTLRHGLGSFEEEMENTRIYRVADVDVPVLSLERIIASKRAAGRPKDQANLLQLENALRALRLRTEDD
jgi:predicted nucleotidyltransferase